MSAEINLRHTQGSFTLDAAFRLDAGVTALFGPSGAGKSTILNAVAGLIRPREGRVMLDGEVLFDSARGVCAPAHRRRIGVVFQDTRLFPHLSVNDNLLFGWRRATAAPPQSEIARIVAMLGLEPLLGRRPRTLSGGERSRVALGRALLMNPRALLLDEPMAALDAARKAEIFPYFERLHDETQIPVLYVSHAVEEVMRLADRVILLRDGRVAAEGSIFDISARLDLATGVDRTMPGTVLDAVVLRHDGAGLSELALAGRTLIVPEVAAQPGAHVRIRIDAKDVMLALAEPDKVSANNVLSATIAAIHEGRGHEADIQLALGETRLIARITRRSAARLGLRPGMAVFAVIKTVTVGGREPR
jgi:molybdate transport system ATP-binding protein